MGVPKFYRWLSERYPCINENVDQFNMPEFDYFYVDMNGVIHICSHPSDDVHFRIPESQIFENIATYIDFLFHLVRPRKVFFLSVDGVAPRSKMNQQRSRRFKSAKEAIEKETKARQNGETLPDDPRFDSNCITPGTEFMYKLHSYMLEILAKKIETCQEWREVEVIYSGYDVPGEGEHKIMDYIRFCKTSNLFESDTRHCLYGLDADLINLGMSTHEPYFSVLREEVSFGRNKQRHCDPIRTNFQLLHLSILRGYIYHEFKELETKIKFKFDLERIIDDWILINFLVGNDFLPHVPKLHINKNGIQKLYDSYKAVLPSLDGYMNDNGTLMLERYQKFLSKLSEFDVDMFNENNFDLRCFDDLNEITFGCGIEMDTDFDLEKLEDEEGSLYSNADSSSDSSENDEDEFTMHKNHYYVEKLHFKDLSTDVPKIVLEYIKGIQWVLHYYFDGCMSWNWFYPYHYGPYVSDLAKIDVSIKFHFEMGTPFQPLVQLLAVLPQASKEILPKAFQQLTYFPDSPLIEYFPNEFQTDLNEKIHDYEAIILIPFMDDRLLKDTFEKYKSGLTEEEILRNEFGFHHILKYEVTPEASSSLDLNRFPHVSDMKKSFNFYVLPREIIFKGVRMNVDLHSVTGFPSLNGIDYTVKMEMARIKVFDFASQNVTMMINVEKKSFTSEMLVSYARNNIDKIIYINWPLLSEAKLVEVIDQENKYTKNKIEKISPEELRTAEISSRSHCSQMRFRRGVILKSVECMVKVLKLQSQRYIITEGKVLLHKEWSPTPLYVPLDLAILDIQKSYRKLPLYKNLSTIFTKNKSFYLISNPYYGYKADIVKYSARENLVLANVFISSEPDFSEIDCQHDYIMRENYYPEYKLASQIRKQLNLPENIIRRLLGSVITQYETNKGRIKRFNIGLKLKYKHDFQQYCIPGYSSLRNNEIFYNKKVITVFNDYYTMFPHVFDMLKSENKSTYELDDMFPGEDMSRSEKIKDLTEIKDWIDSQEFSKIGHTYGLAEYLDNCIVEAIEERIESHMALLSEEQTVSHKYHPSSFYIPEFLLKGSYLPDPRVKYKMFDRVVNIKSSIPVPFGSKGTVIGIYRSNDQLNRQNKPQVVEDGETQENEQDESLLNSVIEVMFDETFEGGLPGRSTQPNIFKMHPSWLINITYGAKTYHKKNMNFKNVYQSIQPPRNPSVRHWNNHFKNVNQYQNEKILRKDAQETHRNNKEFNHSENSPFKVPHPSPHILNNNFPPITSSSVSGLPFPLNLPFPETWESTTQSHLVEEVEKTQMIFSRLNIPSQNINFKNTTNNTNPSKLPLYPPVGPPIPPLDWIVSSKQKHKLKNINSSHPIPTMTILPSSKKSSNVMNTGNGNNSNVDSPENPNKSTQSQIANHPNSNHREARKFNNYFQNFNRNGFNNQQNYHHHHQTNIDYNDNQQTYQHPLNDKSDTTRFVPLSVARNHQHENNLRRHKNTNNF